MTAREVMEASIARAEAVQGQLNGLACTDFDRALARSNRPAKGVFAGVPTAIKDNTDSAGLPTQQAVPPSPRSPAKADSDFAKQFLSTGAISIGKTRLPEFGFSASTEYMTEEPVHNPWNPAYSSGASSGGAAALVAAGVLPIAHANDGGGSIRIPAAACGLVGLKPTRGRTIADPADKSMPIRLIAQGAVTRTVRDTARWMSAAENYYRNPRLAPVRLIEGPSSTRLRVGVIADSVTVTKTDDETRKSVEATAELLASLGHHVEDAALPVGPEFIDDFSIYWGGFLSFAISTGGKQMLGPDFDKSGTDNLTKGLYTLYRKNLVKTPRVLYRLRRLQQQYSAMFLKYDVVLSPALGAHHPPRARIPLSRSAFRGAFRQVDRVHVVHTAQQHLRWSRDFATDASDQQRFAVGCAFLRRSRRRAHAPRIGLRTGRGSALEKNPGLSLTGKYPQSRGNPSMRSPITLSCTSVVPP